MGAWFWLISRHHNVPILDRVLTTPLPKSVSSLTLSIVPDIGCQHGMVCFSQHKIKHSIWLTCWKVVHYEPLPMSQAFTAGLYSERVERVLKHKEPTLVYRKGALFFHINARAYVVWVARYTTRRFDWGTLRHPPFFPKLKRTDSSYSIRRITIFMEIPSQIRQVCDRHSQFFLRPWHLISTTVILRSLSTFAKLSGWWWGLLCELKVYQICWINFLLMNKKQGG